MSHSLPSSAEDIRLSSGPSRKSWFRRCLPCILCLGIIGLVVGLTVHFTGKSPSQLAEQAEDLAEEYVPGFGDEGGEKRADPTEEDRGTISLTSPAFEYGDEIPSKYTADGQDVSPPLRWADLPEGTASLAVLCEDHDYPRPDRPAKYPWVHWVAYDISPRLEGLPEGVPKTEEVAELIDEDTDGTAVAVSGALRQGSTSWGEDSGYRGPDPPMGHPPHRYYFRVLALGDTVGDKLPTDSGGEGATEEEGGGGGVTWDDILQLVEGDEAEVQVLGFGLLMGTYQKQQN